MYMTSILIQKKKKTEPRTSFKENDGAESRTIDLATNEAIEASETRMLRKTRVTKWLQKNTNDFQQSDCSTRVRTEDRSRHHRSTDARPTNSLQTRKLHHCVYTGSTCHTIRSFTNLFLLVGSPSGVVIILLAHTLGTCVSPVVARFFSLCFSPARRKGGKEGRKIVARIQTRGRMNERESGLDTRLINVTGKTHTDEWAEWVRCELTRNETQSIYSPLSGSVGFHQKPSPSLLGPSSAGKIPTPSFDSPVQILAKMSRTLADDGVRCNRKVFSSCDRAIDDGESSTMVQKE